MLDIVVSSPAFGTPRDGVFSILTNTTAARGRGARNSDSQAPQGRLFRGRQYHRCSVKWHGPYPAGFPPWRRQFAGGIVFGEHGFRVTAGQHFLAVTPGIRRRLGRPIRLVVRRGYEADPRQPLIFHRTVMVHGNPIKVEVDFLAGEYAGTGPKHRTQPVHEGRARKARGCDLAFDLFVDTEIAGVLPDGGRDRARVRVSSIVAFLAMKGMALHDRLKEKDAWDIYFTLTNYPGGLDALAQEIVPHIGQGLVQEGFQKIAEKFASPDHVGPKFVADFEEVQDKEDRAILTRDAFERTDYLLRRIALR